MSCAKRTVIWKWRPKVSAGLILLFIIAAFAACGRNRGNETSQSKNTGESAAETTSAAAETPFGTEQAEPSGTAEKSSPAETAGTSGIEVSTEAESETETPGESEEVLSGENSTEAEAAAAVPEKPKESSEKKPANTRATTNAAANATKNAVVEDTRLDGVNYDAILPIPSSVSANKRAWENDLYQYGGYYRKNAEQKVIYLTICLGTEYGYTASMLNVLKEKNVQTCIFVVASEYCKNTGLLRRMVNEGHLVGSHGYRHVGTNTLSDIGLINDMVLSQRAISDALGGYPVRYYRSPSGEFYMRDLYVSQKLGMIPVSNTFAYADYDTAANRSKASALSALKSGLSDGAIYYLHAAPCNTSALGDFIDYARAQGYQFLRLDQGGSPQQETVPETSAEVSSRAESTAAETAEDPAAESTSETVPEESMSTEGTEESRAEESSPAETDPEETLPKAESTAAETAAETSAAEPVTTTAQAAEASAAEPLTTSAQAAEAATEDTLSETSQI